MGCIIHPLNLVMLLLVISAAAIDDSDAGSVTRDQPEPRGDDTNELQHSARDSKERTKRHEDSYSLYKNLRLPSSSVDDQPIRRQVGRGDFLVCVRMAEDHEPYPDVGYFIGVVARYQSDSWDEFGHFLHIDDPTLVEICHYIEDRKYIQGDVVRRILVINLNEDYGWFPAYLKIISPNGCVDTCYWGHQCCNVGGGAGVGHCQPEDCSITHGNMESIECPMHDC